MTWWSLRRQPRGPPRSGDALPRLGEYLTEDSDDLTELLLAGDERRRDLDDRIAAVVGTADEPLLEEPRREEAAQERLRLVVVERLARFLVLHQLERPQVARAAQIAHDVELEQRRELRAKALLCLRHMPHDSLAFHDLEVLERDDTADGM